MQTIEISLFSFSKVEINFFTFLTKLEFKPPHNPLSEDAIIIRTLFVLSLISNNG